jgi:endonuclease/exonuclease/phosphatase family metal-dependent hydrolase
MSHQFAPGDDLIFQLESGLGLLRILAVECEGAETVWHLLAYEEFFPSVEAAEAALAEPAFLHVRNAHMALTDRAFERTPAALLGNRPVTEDELAAYREWEQSESRKVSDRSALLLLGVR